MATKKNFKKGKKYHKKRRGMRGGAIKISYNQIRRIVTLIYNTTIQHGLLVTNVVIANAVYEVLGHSMTREQFFQLANLSINIIITSLQFVFTSLRLTATITSGVATQLAAVTNLATQTLWGAALAISRICINNPIPLLVTGSIATGAVGALAATRPNLSAEVEEHIGEVTRLGLIESVSMMSFNILIRTGLFEDENYNPNPQNLIELNNVADQLVTISNNNTPTNTPESSQPDEDILIEDNNDEELIPIEDAEDNDDEVYMPDLPQEVLDELNRLLNGMQTEVNSLIRDMPVEEIDDVSNALEIAARDSPVCQKRKGMNDTNFKDQKRRNIKLNANSDDDHSPHDEENDDDNADIPPLDPHSSDDEQAGGKKTKHRKRKHNKNKTKKIKHTKKHTKKHIKKHKKHTKKH